MKRLILILTTTFLVLMIEKNVKAQQNGNDSWQSIITLHYGYSFGTNNWEYSHPLYTGYEVQTLSETGSFKAKSFFSAGFEISKGYFGFSTNAGIIPVEIKVDTPGKDYNFNSYFLEIEGIFFPLSDRS